MLLTLFGGGVGILLVLGFVVRVFLLVLFVCVLVLFFDNWHGTDFRSPVIPRCLFLCYKLPDLIVVYLYLCYSLLLRKY